MLYDQASVFDRVDRRIVPGDTMWDHNDSHYFSVGASALSIVMRALTVAGRAPGTIGAVLDYACGHGRVAR